MFENFVAVSLLKYVYAKNDYEGENFQLKYLRTKDKHGHTVVPLHNTECLVHRCPLSGNTLSVILIACRARRLLSPVTVPAQIITFSHGKLNN
jgi:hypothetical protein